MQAFHVKSAGRELRINAITSADAARQFVQNSCRADGTHGCAEIVFVSNKPFNEKKSSEIEFLSTESILRSMGIEVPQTTMRIVPSEKLEKDFDGDIGPSNSLKLCK